MNPFIPIINKLSVILSKESCATKQANLLAIMWELHVIKEDYNYFANSLINDLEVD
jgi:hypothetical protein